MKRTRLLGLILTATILLIAPSSVSSSGNVEVVRSGDGVIYLSTRVTNSPLATPEPSSTSAKSSPNPVLDSEKTASSSPLSDIRIPNGYFSSPVTIINQLIRLVMVIAALLAFAFLILGGFRWITSGGDRGKITQARSTLIAAVLGLVMVSASYAILLLVLRFLGFESLNDVLDSIPPR